MTTLTAAVFLNQVHDFHWQNCKAYTETIRLIEAGEFSGKDGLTEEQQKEVIEGEAQAAEYVKKQLEVENQALSLIRLRQRLKAVTDFTAENPPDDFFNSFIQNNETV